MLCPLYDSTVPSLKVNLNDLIGRTIKISFSGIINCVVTGKKLEKLMVKACLTMPLNLLL